MQKYEDIRGSLNSFDDVFFSGGGIISGIIKLFSYLWKPLKKIKVSHVGTVARLTKIDIIILIQKLIERNPEKKQELITLHKEVLDDPREERLFIWESTTQGKNKDLFTNSRKKGVQLVPLGKKIEGYRGKVWVRKINVERTEQMKKDFLDFIVEVYDRKYEQNLLELFLSTVKLVHLQENLSSFFCSELVISTLQRVGLVSNKICSNYFTPADLFEKIELLKGVQEYKIRLK